MTTVQARNYWHILMATSLAMICCDLLILVASTHAPNEGAPWLRSVAMALALTSAAFAFAKALRNSEESERRGITARQTTCYGLLSCGWILLLLDNAARNGLPFRFQLAAIILATCTAWLFLAQRYTVATFNQWTILPGLTVAVWGCVEIGLWAIRASGEHRGILLSCITMAILWAAKNWLAAWRESRRGPAYYMVQQPRNTISGDPPPECETRPVTDRLSC